MKKFGLVLGSVVVAALAFSACSTPTASNNGVNLSTPGALTTETAVVPNTGLTTQTPAATTSATTAATTAATITTGGTLSTETPAATSQSSTGSGVTQDTATPEATMTSQSSTGGSTAGGTTVDTATPEATTSGNTTGNNSGSTTGNNSGSTAQSQSQLVPMSQFLNLTVQGSDQQTAGKVAGVIVSTTGTQVTAGQSSAFLNIPNVRYVVVDTSSNTSANSSSANSGTMVMVPLDAFDMNAYSNSVANQQSVAAASVLPLKVTAAAVASAPHFSLQTPPDMTAANWDANVSQYWATQGLQIPATGGPQNNGSSNNSGANAAPNSTFMLTAPFNGLTITGQNNAALGQVKDFMMDPRTGQILYAIVSTAQNEAKVYAVPMNILAWQSAASSPNTAAVVNGFLTNLPAAALSAAPSASSVNDFLANSGWQNTVQSYWNAFNGLNK